MTDKTEAKQSDQVLALDVHRDGGDLVYQVTNRSAQPVWAFLLVPTMAGGKLTFAKDAAWLEGEGDLLVVRKVDTPVPDDVKSERVSSGAILLAPNASHGGRIAIGDAPETSGAYQRAATKVAATRVALEVGWLPVHDGQPRQDLDWQGQPFAYLRPEVEPGGQRFVRSSPIAW